jgi:hypothetical protein
MWKIQNCFKYPQVFACKKGSCFKCYGCLILLDTAFN